jgi:hypothetical protein
MRSPGRWGHVGRRSRWFEAHVAIAVLDWGRNTTQIEANGLDDRTLFPTCSFPPASPRSRGAYSSVCST